MQMCESHFSEKSSFFQNIIFLVHGKSFNCSQSVSATRCQISQKVLLRSIVIIFHSFKKRTLYLHFSCSCFCVGEWFRHFLLFDLCSSQARKIQNYYSWAELETHKTGGIFNSFSKHGSHHSFCCNVPPRDPNAYTEQHI